MATLKLPAVNCSRGAPMGRIGRADWTDGRAPDYPRKFWLRRVALNAGGYDNGGAYWGHGAPLYYAETVSTEGEAIGFIRAADRAAAKLDVLSRFPNARFFN